MPKNYYIILGITQDCTSEEIKAAYRRLAKEYHPDYFGRNSSMFLAIQEAYSVLSDPRLRKGYDANLRGKAMQRARRGKKRTASVKPTFSVEKVEPLVPEQDSFKENLPFGNRRLQRFRPSIHTIIDDWLNDFSDIWGDQDTAARQLEVHINLTSLQADRGGHVKIAVPSRVACPECSGNGSVGYYQCWRCSGQGELRGEYPLVLSYPPGIENNHVVKVNLDRYGTGGGYIRVKFNVE